MLKSLLILILFLFSLFSPLPLYAQTATTSSAIQNFSPANVNAPQPEGTLQVELPRVYFVKGVLWADLTVKNNTDRNLYNLIYGIQVMSPKSPTTILTDRGEVSAVHPGWLTGFEDFESFNLKKGETFSKTIEYQMGSDFPSGTYTLIVQIKTPDNQLLGTQYQTFPLQGSGGAVQFDPNSCTMQVNDRAYQTSDGPIVNNGDNASVTCDVSNPGSVPIIVKPQVKYAIDLVALNPNSEIITVDSFQALTLNPGQTQKVTITIPSVLKPQVYQGLLYFVNRENKQISPMADFRWTVPGPSATFLSIDSDKDSYNSGDQANVTVNLYPSADLTWRGFEGMNAGTDLDDAQLKVSLVDANSRECGSSTVSMPKTSQDPSWPEQQVNINITRNCPSFVLKAEISNNGQLLSEVKKGYGGLIVEPENQQVKKERNLTPWIIGGVVLIVLVVAVGYYFYRKRKKNNPPPPPASPPAVSSSIKTVVGILVFLALVVWVPTAEADTIKAPIDSPIESRNVDVRNPATGHQFWANVSSLLAINTATQSASQSATPTGKSTIVVNQDCSVGTLYLYGHADANYCGNFKPGLKAKVFIDGQPVAITNVQSSDSIATFTTNEFDLINRPGGYRTATATLNVPASAQTNGTHTIEVQAGAIGHHMHAGGRYDYESSFSPGGYTACGKNEPCYIKMTTPYSCNRCPAGQTFPHFVCDPTSKTCKQVDSCGVSSCTPGQNQCENCDNPNEIKPHKACVNNSCTTVAACGAPSCNTTADCCPAGQSYDPALDKCVTPACNVSCPDDSFCQKAGDGCTYCVKDQGSDRGSCQRCPNPGETNPHGTCDGVACRQVNTCGVTSCTADNQCYSDNMCKCDGMVADITYPSNAFKFQAFGKVEGTDTQKAEIADVTFRMTKDNLVVAKSEPITPQVVENTTGKVRYKADWQTAPPAVDKNAVYRVFADVRCKPKSATSQSGITNFTPQLAAASQEFPPRGLVWINEMMDKLFNTKEWIGRSVVTEALAQLSSPSPSGNQSNLQLSTLNFVKLMDTDNCRFVMFKFDETLF